MEEWIRKEVYRLADPNSCSTWQDADKFQERLENYMESMATARANEKLKELGIEILNVAEENYYGKTGWMKWYTVWDIWCLSRKKVAMH